MSLFRRNVALLATLGIALVVFCPTVRGPFTATHGPESALRALAYADFVFDCLTALVILPIAGHELGRLADHPVEPFSIVSLPPTPALRC